MMSLQGKGAVITGGAGGIGLAAAQAFLEEGASVVIVDLKEEAVNEGVEKLKKHGTCYGIAADVSSEDDVKKFVEFAENKLGKIDVFVNNAGIEGKYQMITETDVSNFEAVTSVNVKGVLLGMKHVIPMMAKNKSGSIINTASVGGLIGSPGMASYIASKHAVIGLTRTAALETADHGIRVNSVCPAPVNTRMMRAIESGINPADPEGVHEGFAAAVPMKRYAEAQEIAQVMLFLASDKASYITGSQYTVDGGMNPN
ncbi:MAG: SDR family oxidoreductase [Alkalicoccus sp.]|nr:MAG: SDR family oxidoreductase [Alkalicoccus sp.]